MNSFFIYKMEKYIHLLSFDKNLMLNAIKSGNLDFVLYVENQAKIICQTDINELLEHATIEIMDFVIQIKIALSDRGYRDDYLRAIASGQLWKVSQHFAHNVYDYCGKLAPAYLMVVPLVNRSSNDILDFVYDKFQFPYSLLEKTIPMIKKFEYEQERVIQWIESKKPQTTE